MEPESGGRRNAEGTEDRAGIAVPSRCATAWNAKTAAAASNGETPTPSAAPTLRGRSGGKNGEKRRRRRTLSWWPFYSLANGKKGCEEKKGRGRRRKELLDGEIFPPSSRRQPTMTFVSLQGGDPR